jgi:hypothetical protein
MSLSPIVVAQVENDWVMATFPDLPRNFLERIFKQVAYSERSSDEQRAFPVGRMNPTLNVAGELAAGITQRL